MTASWPSLPTLKAIENTPFDMPITFSKSGRAVYLPGGEVLKAYLPCDIEPFYSEPDEYDSRDDWHWPPGDWHGDMDAFTHWRRVYMGWSTTEETREDEKKRQEQLLSDQNLIAALREAKKKSKRSKKLSPQSGHGLCRSNVPRRRISKKSRPRSLQMKRCKKEKEEIPRTPK